MNSLFSLLTYRAFRPDPLLVEEPINARFRQRKLLMLTLGTNRLLVLSAGRMHWRAAVTVFDRDGKPTVGPAVQSPAVSNRDALIEWLREYAIQNKVEYVAVGVGHSFQVQALTAIQRLADVDTMRILRTEPTRLFGDTNNPDDVSGLLHHPDAENSALRFRVRLEIIAGIREVCSAAGLAIARVVCEQAQLLDLAYAAGVGEMPNARGLLIGLPSSYLYVPLDAAGWHTVAFDPQLDDSALPAIQHATSDIPQGGVLAYIDGGLPGFTEILQSLSEFSPVDLMKGQPNAAFISTALN